MRGDRVKSRDLAAEKLAMDELLLQKAAPPSPALK